MDLELDFAPDPSDGLDERDLAWVSAVLEIEGAFFVEKQKRGHAGKEYLYPRIKLETTNEWVVDRLMDKTRMGRKYFHPARKEGHRDQWIWSVSKRRDVQALAVEILPYLSPARREKVLEVL